MSDIFVTTRHYRVKNRTCYYFDDILKIEDFFNFDNILIDEKSHKNILVYNVLCKTLIDAKPFAYQVR